MSSWYRAGWSAWSSDLRALAVRPGHVAADLPQLVGPPVGGARVPEAVPEVPDPEPELFPHRVSADHPVGVAGQVAQRVPELRRLVTQLPYQMPGQRVVDAAKVAQPHHAGVATVVVRLRLDQLGALDPPGVDDVPQSVVLIAHRARPRFQPVRNAARRSPRSRLVQVSSSASRSSRPVAHRSSRSASAGLRESAGPCEYVPTSRPDQAPSVRPSLPIPAVTVASGRTPDPRWVRPPWFSNPVSAGTPRAGSTSPASSPTARDGPRSDRRSSSSSPVHCWPLA